MITITGVGPARDTYLGGQDQPNHQPSGRITALALGADGRRMYAGSFAGVWRSDDAGRTWFQLTWLQPGLGVVTTDIPGALPSPHVFDLAASPIDPDIALVSAVDGQFVTSRDGIYRTADGGRTWTRVISTGAVCHIVWAPDDPSLVYVALGTSVAISHDAGGTWKTRFVGFFVWHLAVGPLEADGKRRVYGAGDSSIWYSVDAGETWRRDGGATFINNVRSVLGGFQSSCGGNALGLFAQQTSSGGQSAGAVLAVDPTNPLKVFLAAEGGAVGPSYYHPGAPDGTLCNSLCSRLAGEASLWEGDFRNFEINAAADWGLVPGPPVPADTTPSGNTYVFTKPTSGGFLVFFSDNSHVFVAAGTPQATNAWHRLEGQDVSVGKSSGTAIFTHVDPHAMAFTPDFEITLKPAAPNPPYDQNSVFDAFIGGTIWMANDGGVYWSEDGGRKWQRPHGLETLDPVNIAGLFSTERPPALYFGCGDNDEFYSLNGGASWGDPKEGCGDCDAWFSDPARGDQVMQFLPRKGFGDKLVGMVSIITSGDSSDYPDPSDGDQKRYIPASRALSLVPEPHLVPYPTSGRVLRGYRPVIRTLATELPLPDGDYVFIDQQLDGTATLLRTTAISSITQLSDWADPAKAEPIGPTLPKGVDIVQVAGGHLRPVFYVGDKSGTVYKLNRRTNTWDQIVPAGPGGSIIGMALRWFVDPFEPNTIYVLTSGGVKLSVDGGVSWAADPWLTHVITANGQLTISASLLQDMLFLRGERATRFVFGTAGVGWTPNFGVEWYSILNSIALPGRPESGFFDPISDPSDRALYVECEGRSILRIGGLPELPPFQPPEPIDLMYFAAILEA